MRQFFARLLDLVNEMQRETASPRASLDRSNAAAQRAHETNRMINTIAEARTEKLLSTQTNQGQSQR